MTSWGRVVEAHDLRRSYRTRAGTFRREKKEVEAVRGVSFGIEQGELFGLLGPNGAGKTTTLDMLLGLTDPSDGSLSVFGRRPIAAAKSGTSSSAM